MSLRSFKELLVRQKAMDLLAEVYRVTANYPDEERFGLAAHTRKTVVSIPSNIAEGYARHHRPEYVRHVDIAYGSAAELETQLIAADRLGFIPAHQRRVFQLHAEVERMLASLRRSLRSGTSAGPSNP
jgi:four helix bundle protein